MGQHIRWQAIITLTGIAMTIAFLSFLSFSRRTITIVVPEVGGKYTEGLVGTPQFINPLLAQANQVDQDLVALIFSGLTCTDGQGQLVPDLAKRWQVSEDGLGYDFYLRQDVLWQDGQPFTADDVLFTISLIQNADFPGIPQLATAWRAVKVEKVDNYTVHFALSEPFPSFMDFTTIGLLPAHILRDTPVEHLLYHPFNLQPIGTGLFKLDTVNVEFARLLPNPFYYGTKPKLTQVEFRFYQTYPQIIAAYQKGEILGINYIPPEALSQATTVENLNLYHARLSNIALIYLNLRDEANAPFLQELEVRQALLSALDRPTLLDRTLHGQGLVANGVILPWSWAYNPAQPTVNFDQARATHLLTRVGWVDNNGDGILDRSGQPLEFTLLSNNEPAKIKIANFISQQWRQVGISTTVEIVPTGLNERLQNHTFQAALVELHLGGDPDPYPLWHTSQIDSGQNYGGWNNRRASTLLEQARMTVNQGQRNDRYFSFQRIFAEEMPVLAIYYPVHSYGVHQEVQEVQISPLLNPADRFRNIAAWYIVTSRVIHKEVGVKR